MSRGGLVGTTEHSFDSQADVLGKLPSKRLRGGAHPTNELKAGIVPDATLCQGPLQLQLLPGVDQTLVGDGHPSEATELVMEGLDRVGAIEMEDKVLAIGDGADEKVENIGIGIGIGIGLIPMFDHFGGKQFFVQGVVVQYIKFAFISGYKVG